MYENLLFCKFKTNPRNGIEIEFSLVHSSLSIIHFVPKTSLFCPKITKLHKISTYFTLFRIKSVTLHYF